MALISFRALDITLKHSGITLREKLLLSDSGTSNGLTAAEISQKCSTAVFYIEAYKDDNYSEVSATGSGFFINGSGVAITCYHVLIGSKSARITRIGGDEYNVDKVVYGSATKDIAVIRVSKTSTGGQTVAGFPYLEFGSSSGARNGDDILYHLKSDGAAELAHKRDHQQLGQNG